MAQPRVSIRLGTDGKAQVKQDFVEIGDAGSVQAQRYQAAWERATAEAERALDKQAKAGQRLAAAGMINPTTGGGYDQSAKSAVASASVFTKELERQEIEAKRLIAAIDPLFAAQMRYAQAIERINAVKATGQLSEQRYQQLLAVEEAELNRATLAMQRHGNMAGSARMGMQQLGFQLGDISTQFAMGTRASVIFAQQSGQVIQAFQLMGGEGNKVLNFLRGPWGIALSVAAIALTPLISKLFETGESVDSLVEKLKKEAAEAALNDRAHRAFQTTLEGVTEALRKNREALDKLAEGERSAAERAADLAFGGVRVLQQRRDETAAMIEQAKAQIERNRAQAGLEHVKGTADPRLAAVNEALARLQTLQNNLSKTDAQIAEARKQAVEALSRVTVERASADEAEKIKKKYEGRNGLIEQARQRALAEGKTTAELAKQVELLKQRERAEIKAVQERDRKGPNIEHQGGASIENAQIGAFFDIANRFRGKSETSDRAVLQSFFRAANENLDPEKTAWCAAFVNAVLATGGVKGTGSLAAKSFLGFGKDDRSSPQKGDIVIVRSGGSPSGMHVGFLDSIDAKGNVSVLGGNTGNRVANATFAAKDVLGIRRPPTPAETYASDLKDAQDAADEAVKQYLEHLKKIVPAQLEAAAKPIKQRIDATAEVKKVNEQHEETMTLLRAELGLTGLNADKRADILHLLQRELDLRRQFPGMTQQQIDLLIAQEKAEQGLRAELDRTEARMEEFQRVGEDIVDTVFNPDNWRNWGDAGLKILREILDLWLQMSLINPLKNKMFGTNLPSFGSNVGTGDLFGFLGSLVGGGASSAASSAMGPMVGLTDSFGGLFPTLGFGGNALGTEYFSGGMTWVGEFGKELLHLPRGSRITPAGESRRLEAANDRARLVPVGDTYQIGVTVAGGGSKTENRETGMQIGGAIRQQLAVTSRKGLMGGSRA